MAKIPDDSTWENPSRRQLRQVRDDFRRSRGQDGWTISDSPTPAEVQIKSLQAYAEGKGPHINFRDSVVSKLLSEAFESAGGS